MNNIIKLLFSISFIKKLVFILVICTIMPIPSFIKTIVITSVLSFLSFLIILLRLPNFAFTGIIKYPSVRFFYDGLYSIIIVIASLFTGGAIFIFSSLISALIFSMFLESYQEQISKLKE